MISRIDLSLWRWSGPNNDISESWRATLCIWCKCSRKIRKILQRFFPINPPCKVYFTDGLVQYEHVSALSVLSQSQMWCRGPVGLVHYDHASSVTAFCQSQVWYIGSDGLVKYAASFRAGVNSEFRHFQILQFHFHSLQFLYQFQFQNLQFQFQFRSPSGTGIWRQYMYIILL